MAIYTPTKLPSVPLLVIIITLMGAFGPISIDLYLPAFLQIQEGLATTDAEVKKTLTFFLIGLCIGMMFYGPLSDKYGRRNIILLGAIIYSLTSIGSTLISYVESLQLLRLLQAIGAGACMVVGRAVIRDVFKGKQVAVMMSVIQVIMMIAPLLAPLVGVLVLKFFDNWRALFWVLTFFGSLAFLLTFFFLPETYKKGERPEITIKATFYNYYLILKDRRSLGAMLGCALPAGMVFAYVTGSSYLYQGTYGLSEFQFSLLFGLNIVGIIISAFLNIVLLRHFTISTLAIFGLIWISLAGILMLLIGDYSLWGFFFSTFMLMCVSGFIGNNIISQIIELNYDRAGAAMALNSATQFFVGAVASSIVMQYQSMLTIVMGVSGLLGAIAYFFLFQPWKELPSVSSIDTAQGNQSVEKSEASD